MSNTSYDLLSFNGYSLPDVSAGKGEVTVIPNPKYNKFEGEDGGAIVDVTREDMINGSVSYSGLLQSELQAIQAHKRLVSTMTIYNPATGQVRTFKALVLDNGMERIIHDANANAWSYSFEFEEIGNA